MCKARLVAGLLTLVLVTAPWMSVSSALAASASEINRDANAALATGIPALTLGVAFGGAMHTLEEWIDAASLERGLRQLEHVLTARLRPA